MSALHLTARRQTGRTHVCTGITESVASKYIILSLPLSRSLFHSFLLSHSTLSHSMCFCMWFFLHHSFNPFCFFSLSFTIIIWISLIIFKFVSFFTLFFFVSSIFRWKKGLRKILSSQHWNVMKCFHCLLCTNLFFVLNWLFFAFTLDSTDFIPNRIIFRESSDNTIPVRRNGAFRSDRTVSSDLCPLSTCIRK